jgi:spermidine synthase
MPIRCMAGCPCIPAAGGAGPLPPRDGPRYRQPRPERAAAVADGCSIWSPRWQRGAFDAIPAAIERELAMTQRQQRYPQPRI